MIVSSFSERLKVLTSITGKFSSPMTQVCLYEFIHSFTKLLLSSGDERAHRGTGFSEKV